MPPGVPGSDFLAMFFKQKLAGIMKKGYFKWGPDVHDHLGEVQSLGQPGVGHDPGVFQGIFFWQCWSIKSC